MVPEFKKLMHKRASKAHYDHKKPIKLMFKDGLIVTENDQKQSQRSYHHGMSIQSHAFDYTHQAFEADEDDDQNDPVYFEDSGEDQEEMVMAKAYDYDGSDEENYATAKAYDDDHDDDIHYSNNSKEEPEDRNNPFSDVFQVDDHLFENEDSHSGNNSADEDEEFNDQFARDLQAVLSGKKSLAQLSEYADQDYLKEEKAKPAAENASQQVEEKMVKDEAIFEQLALDMNRLQTFQLGEVHLEEIFDRADADLLNENTAKKQKLEEVVTEAAMTLDGMELAEDFEYMESLAESSPDNGRSSQTRDAYEDAEIVEEEETTESAEL
ncbi:hypothetical protein [uncultured Fluviicola sp.]|uniref:hypothetical protein n=1 Tax=uncultured Fluviicola sp. TaxID=463303 RepID=UPI0025F92548|nr:hypothetical protein [uncultured Fluviicola sp.]